MIKTITLNNRIIKISIVKKIPDEPKKTLGVFDAGDRKIWIKKRKSKDEMMYTLLHEINHAILWTQGAHNALKLKDEELVCDNFANGFMQLIRSNPKLIKLIKGK